MSTEPVSPARLRRVALQSAALLGLAAATLAWQVAHAENLFADGLRYIAQARRLEAGGGVSAVREAVDHPLYPLAIAATWRATGLPDDADGWQRAAQLASAAAGVLLVVPLYLLARSLFGRPSARLGVALVYLVPVPVRVFGDALSESTFLLFWTWGVLAAFRYLSAGSTRWMAIAVLLGSAAYLVRPEGLLLPLALAGTLALSPFLRATRLPARRWGAGMLLLAMGGASLVGPFVAFKGGIGTKPAVARLLGLAPPSRPDAVERERPLDPDQSRWETGLLAAKAVWQAIRGAVTTPLLPVAALGIAATLRRRWRSDARAWLFLGVVLAGSLLALLRLHATGGYCTPRHGLIVSLPLLLAAGAGVRSALAGLLRRVRPRPARAARLVASAACLAFVAAVLTGNGRALLAPLNEDKRAYRDAGHWLRDHADPGDRVADVTGWALFHGDRRGYTFADLHAAPADPALRWVVVRDAHLTGPWGYCDRLRDLVRGATLVARFPERRREGQMRVSIYELGRPPETADAGQERR